MVKEYLRAGPYTLRIVEDHVDDMLPEDKNTLNNLAKLMVERAADLYELLMRSRW